MSAIANIVVPDAATTPVNHTFIPQKVTGDVAAWNEKLAATPQGYWELATSFKDPTTGGKVYRLKQSLAIPTLKSYTDLSGNPVTVVDYTCRVSCEWLLPLACTLQNRKDLRKLFVGIINDVQIMDNIENLNHSF